MHRALMISALLICLYAAILASSAPVQPTDSDSSSDMLKALDAKMANLRAQLQEAKNAEIDSPLEENDVSQQQTIIPQQQEQKSSDQSGSKTEIPKQNDAFAEARKGRSLSQPKATATGMLVPQQKAVTVQDGKHLKDELQEELEVQSGKTGPAVTGGKATSSDKTNFKVLMWGGAAGMGIV